MTKKVKKTKFGIDNFKNMVYNSSAKFFYARTQ